jgi:O-antigen/teichoic acid export membrane protein
MTALAARRSGASLARLFGLGAARGAASLLGFVGVLLVARLLEPSELGRWALALAVQGYALHLAELGLRSVATVELARSGGAWTTLLGRYLTLRLALAAVMVGLVVAGTAWLQPESLVLVAVATLAILAVALQLDWIALVDDRPGLAAAPLLARPLAFLLLLSTWPGVIEPVSIAICYLASWGIAATVSWPALARPGQPRPRGAVPPPDALLRRGAPLMLVTLTNQAQLSADLLVVGWSLGASSASDYFLASQIAVAALLFANTANQLALAQFPSLGNQSEQLRRAVSRQARQLLGLALLLAAGLGLLGPWLVPLLFGIEHASAVGVLQALLPWLVLQHLTQLFQGALAATGHERAVLGGNLVLLAVLLPALALAACSGTLAAFTLARTTAEVARVATLAQGLRRAGLARK